MFAHTLVIRAVKLCLQSSIPDGIGAFDCPRPFLMDIMFHVLEDRLCLLLSRTGL